MKAHPKIMKAPLTLVGLMVLTGCVATNVENSDPEDSANASDHFIQPGTTLQDLGPLAYDNGHPYARDIAFDEHNSFGICDAVASADTIVIAHVMGLGEPHIHDCDNPGPYAQSYRAPIIEVVAVAAGRKLSSSTQIFITDRLGYDVFIRHAEPPQPEEFWLLGLNDVDGEWYLPFGMKINLDDPAPLANSRVALPNTFEELSRQAIEASENLAAVCPEHTKVSDRLLYNAMHNQNNCERRRQQEDEANEPDEEPYDPCDGDPECR